MAKLHFNFLNHIIKVIKGEVGEDGKQLIIVQLEQLITEDKNKIKLKAGNTGSSPGEIRN